MITLLLYLLVCFGLIYAITESVVFARVRIVLAASGGPLREVFLYCASCVGFWVGTGVYVLGARPLDAWSPLWACGAGFLVMGVISVVRAFAPDFLPGAYDRERDIIEAVRARRAPDADHGSGSRDGHEHEGA